MNYNGIMTALVTPLTKQNEVDDAKFRDLINFQIESGVHSLLFLGGTGEYTALSIAQKKEVIDLAIKIVNGRVPVVIGILDPGIGDTIELGLYAKDAGVNALMIVTPYYVKPTQQGLIDYYKKLDQTLDMPILLYNIPHKTGVNMLPTTVETIVNETSNVVGMKECTENFGQMVELINLVGDKITVLAGEEFVAVASMIFGAKGAVMASANVMPRLWIKLYELIRNGEKEKAIEVNKEYNSVFKTIFMEGNPGPLKAAMNMTGLSAGSVSTPLLSPTTETVNELTQVMKYLKLYV